MPKTPAAEVDAGGRAVRVSSPDRVIYEPTEKTAEVTKLMVAEYFAGVGDGLMRALRDRPTALERWTSGVRPGMKLATGPQDRDADAVYQKPMPKGAPDYLESVEVTFPSVRVAGVARELLEELGIRGYPKTSGNRGVHVFVRIEPRWEFTDVRHAAIGFGRALEKRDAGVTTAWWKEERGERIFVDFNQNTRERTLASAYSLRPIAGAPVSTPV